eukprot:GHRR01001807.1.p1 GENE.GHRR01001807.1~~GHRR01001807.1.p1  ORF type:complete len:551 (+),score=256.25 GHRR01001807.1:137-1789(+)
MRQPQVLKLLAHLSAGAQRSAAAQPGFAATTALAGAVHITGSLSTAKHTASTNQWRTLTSSLAPAAAAAQSQVHGNVAAVLSEVDAIISREDAGPKIVADAAMALAYLQARSDRRLWGKIFERAAANKGSFDPASLTSFLWAATTAGVGHFKTTFELSGSAVKLLGSFNTAQLATVVEALGTAGVNDVELMQAVSSRVASKPGDFTASQLAKILYGFAAAGNHDVALMKAALGALAGKAGADASARDLAQVVWALAKLGRADNNTLGSLSKALSAKLGAGEAAQDVVAAVWGFAQLNHKPDAGLLTKAAAAIKGAAADLSTEQQIQAAWSLALLGQGDKDLYSSLFGVLGSAIAAAPDSASIPLLAKLAEAQMLVADKLGGQAPKLPEQVQRYAWSMHGIVTGAANKKANASSAAFKSEVAEATARATGARYKPEITAAVSKLAKITHDGLPVEIALDDLKVAVLPVEADALSTSSARAPLGPLAAKMELLRARGYAPALVPAPGFNAQPDATAKAQFVLSAIRAAAPGVSSQLNALEKKLKERFDPYAE